MNMEQKQYTDDDFYSKFTTIPNHIRPNENNEFETYGEELEYVRKLAIEQPTRVWTIIDNNSGWLGIVPGYHFVNRIAYLITEESAESNEPDYTIYDNAPIREQWDKLPLEAIEEIIGEKLRDSKSLELLEDIRDENFYLFEELGEQGRDEILKKYNIDDTNSK